MKTGTLILLLLTIFKAFSQSVECERMYKEAISFAGTGAYAMALNKLAAAKICNPQEKKFDSLIVKIYEEINRQKNNADSSRREAERALAREKIAKQLEAEAKNDAINQKEIAQNQLARNYWNSGKAAMKNNNNLEALHYIAEAVVVSKDKYLTKNLLIDIEPYLPVTQLNTTFSHGKDVNSAVFSPDGRMILTAGKGDHTARLWDVETGRQIGADMIHPLLAPGELTALFSPDGKWILTSGTDTTVRIWEVATGKQSRVISQHKDSADSRSFNFIRAAIFSPDGEMIVASSYRTIYVWNARNGKQIGAAFKHEDVNNAGLIAVFSPDGKQILTASDTTARLWKTETGEQIGSDMNHPGNGFINSVVFSADGEYILTASDYKSGFLWKAATTKLVTSALQHDGGGHTAVFSKDGRRILTAGWDSTVKIWDITGDLSQSIFMKSNHHMFRAVFNYDEKIVLTSGFDYVALWDAATGRSIGTPIKIGGDLKVVSFVPGGNRFLTACEDGIVLVWDSRDFFPVSPVIQPPGIQSNDLNRGEKYVLRNSSDKRSVSLWDARSGNQIGKEMTQKTAIESAFLSADGKYILTLVNSDTLGILSSGRPTRITSFGHHTVLWDARSGMLKNYFPKLPVNTAAFSSNGNYILITSGNTISLYDPGNGKQIGKEMVHGNNSLSSVDQAIFSPDGKRILTVSRDWSVNIWETGTGNKIGVTAKHPGDILTAGFSSSGKYFLTAGSDNTARLWETATGTAIGPAMAHEAAVYSAVFSKDEKHILTASEDGSVRIWETGTGNLIGKPFLHTVKVESAYFSPDENKIFSVSNDTTRLWNIEGDLDIPPDLFHLQTKVITGASLNTETNELEIISINQWNTLNKEYINKAQEHYKNCKYKKYNVWARFHINKLGKVIPGEQN